MVVKCINCGHQWNYIDTTRPRSTGPLSQNHHLNSHVQEIAAETGHDFDEIKVELKARAVKRGFPPPHEIVVDGQRYAAFKSEAQCSALECSYLIDEAHALAVDLCMTLREGE